MLREDLAQASASGNVIELTDQVRPLWLRAAWFCTRWGAKLGLGITLGAALYLGLLDLRARAYEAGREARRATEQALADRFGRVEFVEQAEASTDLPIDEEIRRQSEKGGVPAVLTLAIAHQESGTGLRPNRSRFEPHMAAKARKAGWDDETSQMLGRSWGLLQVIPILHAETCDLERRDANGRRYIAFEELTRPRVGIECGIKVLRNCLEYHKAERSKVQRYRQALSCYNGDPDLQKGYAAQVLARVSELVIEGGA